MGMIDLTMMRMGDAPWRRAVAMSSALLNLSASAQARRAIGGQDVRAMAIIALLRLGQSAATKANERMRLRDTERYP